MKDKQENKEVNEERRHTKRVLEKSTRVDLRNKNKLLKNIFFYANCAMFTDLTGMIESELECEKLTTETSMSQLNNGTGMSEKQ